VRFCKTICKPADAAQIHIVSEDKKINVLNKLGNFSSLISHGKRLTKSNRVKYSSRLWNSDATKTWSYGKRCKARKWKGHGLRDSCRTSVSSQLKLPSPRLSSHIISYHIIILDTAPLIRSTRTPQYTHSAEVHSNNLNEKSETN